MTTIKHHTRVKSLLRLGTLLMCHPVLPKWDIPLALQIFTKQHSSHCGAVGRDEDVLLVGSAPADELLDDVGGVELAGDGDEAVALLPEALALQAKALGDPVVKQIRNNLSKQCSFLLDVWGTS